jgi:hypothetical protein
MKSEYVEVHGRVLREGSRVTEKGITRYIGQRRLESLVLAK